MSVLDELREALEEAELSRRDESEPFRWEAILHAFEAAHPGLVDLTCCFCGRPVTDKSKVRASRFVCPDCAKEANDE